MLKGKSTELTLEFGSGGKFFIPGRSSSTARYCLRTAVLSGRIWAQKKIAELELRPNKHEDEITELQGTLHRHPQHFSHRTRPLGGLRDPPHHPPRGRPAPTYFAKIEQRQKEKEKVIEGRIAGVIKKFEQRVAWWNKTFQFGPGKPKTRVTQELSKTVFREWTALSGSSPQGVSAEAAETLEKDDVEEVHGGKRPSFAQSRCTANIDANTPLMQESLSETRNNQSETESCLGTGRVPLDQIGARRLTTSDSEWKATSKEANGSDPARRIPQAQEVEPQDSHSGQAQNREGWYSVYLTERKENESSSPSSSTVRISFWKKKTTGFSPRDPVQRGRDGTGESAVADPRLPVDADWPSEARSRRVRGS